MSNIQEIITILNDDITPNEMVRYTKYSRAKIFFNNGICLDHPYNDVLNKKYRFLKKFRFNKTLKYWELSGNLDFETARFLIDINNEFPEYYWTIDAESLNVLKIFISDFELKQKEYKNIMQIKKSKKVNLNWQDSLKVEPYEYQKLGIKFIEANNGIAFIGDDMGVGKTMQAIGYTAINNLKTLVVCPASLKYNWIREINDFTINKRSIMVTNLDENDQIVDNMDYYVINYDQLDKYKKQLLKLKFDCIVVDESQYIKTSKAERSRALNSFKKIPKRILLSGTAIKNRVIEFYNQLHFLRPDIFGNKEVFGLRYCDAQPNTFGRGFVYNGASNLKELNSRISPFYLRRLKSDVLDLPAKEIKIVNYELTSQQMQSYALIQKDLNKNLVSLDKKIVLSKIVKMKQILSSYKLKFIKEFVEDLEKNSSEGKIIIFSQFIHSQTQLLEMFKDRACSILGDYSDTRRKNEEDEFNKNPDKTIMVASSLAAGVGLNLTIADKVIFVDLLWNTSDHKQCEDRAYRNGQKKAVSVFYMIARETIEDMIWQLFDRKDYIIKQLIDDNVKDLNIEDKFLNLLIENSKNEFKTT